jgi:hypothetical protein
VAIISGQVADACGQLGRFYRLVFVFLVYRSLRWFDR